MKKSSRAHACLCTVHTRARMYGPLWEKNSVGTRLYVNKDTKNNKNILNFDINNG